MRRLAMLLVGAGALASTAIAGGQTPGSTLYVNCAVTSDGDGSARSPLSTISAALPVARTMSAPVRISVAAGVCSRETLPIRLDVPVRLRGARSPATEDDDRPDGNQHQDTIITASGLTATFFVVTAPDVQISHLSIVGARPLGADGNRAPALTPLGILALDATAYAVSHLRVVGVGQAIRSEASSGVIRNNYVSGDNPIFMSGGSAATPAEVTVTNNRVVYRVNGIPAAGGTNSDTHLRARISDNDLLTPFMNTGPTSPAALRLSPFTVGTAGTLDVVVENNFIGGAAKYGVMIHAGQPIRADGARYTGTLTARLADNVIAPDVLWPSLVTFTNSRATVLPCELQPALPPSECPTLSPVPVYSEYLTDATYDLEHSGDMDAALIDHPEFHPVDRYPLGNRLIINKRLAGYETFVVVPGVGAGPGLFASPVSPAWPFRR